MEPTKLPFNETLARNIDRQIERVDKNFVSMIAVDGGQGEGKTTLAKHIVDYINEKRGLPKCSMLKSDHPQISLGGKEFISNFNKCRTLKLPAIIYDEAGDFSKRGSISYFNSAINRRLETFRSSKIIIIIVMPNFNVLDNNLFDLRLPRMLVHCYNRARTVKYGNYKVYSYTRLNWIRYWHQRLPSAIRYMCYDKVFPNFYGHFNNLSESEALALSKLSDYGKDKQSVLTEIKMSGLLDYEAMAGKLGRSIIWVRTQVSKYHIKPARTIATKNFYTPEACALILNSMTRPPK